MSSDHEWLRRVQGAEGWWEWWECRRCGGRRDYHGLAPEPAFGGQDPDPGPADLFLHGSVREMASCDESLVVQVMEDEP